MIDPATTDLDGHLHGDLLALGSARCSQPLYAEPSVRGSTSTVNGRATTGSSRRGTTATARNQPANASRRKRETSRRAAADDIPNRTKPRRVSPSTGCLAGSNRNE